MIDLAHYFYKQACLRLCFLYCSSTNIYIRQVMYEGTGEFDHEHFDNLLDFSNIEHHHSSTFHELSASKDKLNLSEKQRTREESYEELTKMINQAKLEQNKLRKELQVAKQNVFREYLGKFKEEFDYLNEENQNLRKELGRINTHKREDKTQRLSNRSSIKVRSSVNSVIGDENKKTHSKVLRKNNSPNMLLKKKQPKMTESSAFLGRSQVQSPSVMHHKRRESQLTERKAEQHQSIKTEFNCSINDDNKSEWNFRESTSKQSLRQGEQKNIFVEILEKMLKQQIAHDKEKYSEIYLQSTRSAAEDQYNQAVFINQLQTQIKQSNEKLEMLNLVVSRYQYQIEGMNINLKTVTDLTTKLYQVKGKYVEMERKCQNLHSMRKEVAQKEQMLSTQREQQQSNKEQSKVIASVETLIKMFTNNPSKTFTSDSSKLYMNYHREIKELFKFDREQQTKRHQKVMKVRQMIDSIRQNRKKFNQLIQIYEGRIAKLEQKIIRIRKQQSSQSAKSSVK